MKIEYMREFVELGENLNFTFTADELYISQPALTRHISSIEKELGEKLLFRTTHYVKLTPAGEIALEKFKSVWKEYDGFIKQLELLNEGYSGDLQIGISYYAVNKYMSSTLADFKNTYPDVSLSLQSLQPYEILIEILNKRQDIGLVTHYETDINKDLNYINLSQEQFYIALPKNHKLANKEYLSIQDLERENLLLSSTDDSFTEYILSYFKSQKLMPFQIYYCEHVDLIFPMILKHNALAIMPEHMQNQASCDVMFIPFKEDNLFLNVSYVYRKDNINPTLKLYLNMINN